VKPQKDADKGGGQPLIQSMGEGALKWVPGDSVHEGRKRVCQESATKGVRGVVVPELPPMGINFGWEDTRPVSQRGSREHPHARLLSRNIACGRRCGEDTRRTDPLLPEDWRHFGTASSVA